MDRRAFIGAFGGGLVVGAPATAQPQTRAYEIGLLTNGGDPARSAFWLKFLDALRELNYVEGRNLTVRRAFADGDVQRLRGLAAGLVEAKVDLIVTTAVPETLAAKTATSTIPIVMTVVPDPVEEGLVSSLSRPGANVTGLTGVPAGISQKYVELLHEVAPSASMFTVVTRAGGPSRELRSEIDAAAQRLRVTLSFAGVRAPEDLDAALVEATKQGTGGIIAPSDALTYRYRTQLVQLVLKHRLPAIYWHRDYVEAGGLMSYGASDVSRRAAYFVDKILRGAKPADLPVEQPTRFELVVNRTVAKAIGLALPQSLLLRADEVTE